MIVRKATLDDVEGIFEVYKKSAETYIHSLTQQVDELNIEYIRNDVVKISLDLGLILVAQDDDGKIIGSFKSYTSPFRALSHVMSNTTFVTTPDYEGKRAFSVLIKKFFETIRNEYPHIYQVDGVPHESNKTAINCYLRNGYEIVGKVKDKIFNNSTNSFEDEIIIMWKNPNFSMDKLLEYQEYLKKYLENKYKQSH